MQYTNFIAFLLATPALLPLILGAPTPPSADALNTRSTTDGIGTIASEYDYHQKRQIAIGDEIAQPPTPNTDTSPPPPPPQPAGNGHGTPGNSGTGPGTNTNDGLTPEQQRQQGNRIQAGIAHDDTHKKRQIAFGDEIAQPPTPNTDTSPPPSPPQPAGNGHATPGNSASNPGTNKDGLTPSQETEIDNTVQAGIAHDDTH